MLIIFFSRDNMFIFRLFFSLMVAILFSGCAKQTAGIKMKKDKVVVEQRDSQPILRQFSAKVEGVECSICAQDAVNAIKSIKGVERADFKVKNGEYENGYLCFSFDLREGNFDVRACDDLLQHHGFELASLQGAFYIEPFSSQGKKYVALNDEIALPFSYGQVEVLKKMIASKHDKLFAEGIIEKDCQDETYCFRLLGQA